jgi:hypothetical protein
MEVPAPVCNYRRGEYICTAVCHKISGSYRAKCREHLVKANIKTRNRVTRLAINNEELSVLRAEKLVKSRAAALLRMQKFRADRKLLLLSIENIEVQRIATTLDQIHDGKRIVQVDKVISPTIKKTDIKLKLQPEKITFSAPKPHLRTMQPLEDPEAILGNVIAAIRIVFPQCTSMVVKMLKSKAGDTAQITHTDYVPEVKPVQLKHLKAFHFSAIISIEHDTRLLISKAREEIEVPLHSMVLFRGDMLHAGAAYKTANSRLFISASSTSFPATDDVFLHYSK